MRKKRFDQKNKGVHKATRESDAKQRITHLLGASYILSKASPTLSRFYQRTTRQICRRINLVTDCISVKRNFCKRCNSLLCTTGGTVRIAAKRERHVVITCGHCANFKRFLTRQGETFAPFHRMHAQNKLVTPHVSLPSPSPAGSKHSP